MSWSIILHGGAKSIPPEQSNAHKAGCLEALAAGRSVLENGGHAIDAVEASVRKLEDDPTFNAGYGSVLNADGEVEMDAAIMDGTTLDIGAVAAIRGVRHPVSVARAMLLQRPVLLAGEGAYRFAEAQGLELCEPEAMIAPGQRVQEGCDTVGCVARDSFGRVAAATSTGGLRNVMAGRVGDTPLPGCGYYADDAAGAVAFSGEGEDIARVLLAARVVGKLGAEPPDVALTLCLPLVARFGGDAGGIAVDAAGRTGWAHNSPNFAVAYAAKGQASLAFLSKDEELAGR